MRVLPQEMCYWGVSGQGVTLLEITGGDLWGTALASCTILQENKRKYSPLRRLEQPRKPGNPNLLPASHQQTKPDVNQ